MQSNKGKILVHSCCAPCSTYVLDYLSQSYNITILFYNPNIQPEEEYVKRLQEMEKLCKIKETELFIPDYEDYFWMESIKGLENVPEGAERCRVCFDVRLKKTAETAFERGFTLFATTLTVSPHKNAVLINSIGTNAADSFKINFLKSDFKKKDGYRKSCELSRKYGLYRQKYCGCLYSR